MALMVHAVAGERPLPYADVIRSDYRPNSRYFNRSGKKQGAKIAVTHEFMRNLRVHLKYLTCQSGIWIIGGEQPPIATHVDDVVYILSGPKCPIVDGGCMYNFMRFDQVFRVHAG